METPPAVRIEHLVKKFRLPTLRTKEVLAVDDVSFTIQPGEVYGLIGPNGSGKSTTLKVLLGLLKPTSGKSEIFGQDSAEIASRDAVGYLPENPYFYKHLTARETIQFYGKLCGLNKAELKQRTDELLHLVKLEHAADRAVGGYSKGMLQRIGLAQALVQNPVWWCWTSPQRAWILPEPHDSGFDSGAEGTGHHHHSNQSPAGTSAGSVR